MQALKFRSTDWGKVSPGLCSCQHTAFLSSVLCSEDTGLCADQPGKLQEALYLQDDELAQLDVSGHDKIRHILVPDSSFTLLRWNITTQCCFSTLGRRKRETRVSTMVFYMPESNYPPFCGASSEITDLTVTKYCHPGKPFCNQQGGFFLLSSYWKGPLFSGWTPGECYQQWPLPDGTLSSCDKTQWRWHQQQRLGAAGTQKPSHLGHCMGKFGLSPSFVGTTETSPACVFFLFPS